jgi:hypothetical protein
MCVAEFEIKAISRERWRDVRGGAGFGIANGSRHLLLQLDEHHWYRLDSASVSNTDKAKFDTVARRDTDDCIIDETSGETPKTSLSLGGCVMDGNTERVGRWMKHDGWGEVQRL